MDAGGQAHGSSRERSSGCSVQVGAGSLGPGYSAKRCKLLRLYGRNVRELYVGYRTG